MVIYVYIYKTKKLLKKNLNMILNNLVFSGGSIRAIGYIGCLKALEEYELTKDIQTFAGTSAGGIFVYCII